MNKVFRTLAKLSEKQKKNENKWPVTYAFNKAGECIGTYLGGVATFEDYPKASYLNIRYRNGKIRVITR